VGFFNPTFNTPTIVQNKVICGPMNVFCILARSTEKGVMVKLSHRATVLTNVGFFLVFRFAKREPVVEMEADPKS
jgi:hypothetical protein